MQFTAHIKHKQRNIKQTFNEGIGNLCDGKTGGRICKVSKRSIRSDIHIIGHSHRRTGTVRCDQKLDFVVCYVQCVESVCSVKNVNNAFAYFETCTFANSDRYVEVFESVIHCTSEVSLVIQSL